MIEFGSPVYFALAILVAAMVAGAVALWRWRDAARHAFAGMQSAHWPNASFWPRMSLVLAAAALLVFAAARPQWGQRDFTRERQGVDIVVVLDISSSMQATDASPTRLGLAQQELTRLIDAQRGNRVGLVFFAGTAVLRSPLSTDIQAVNQIIDRAGQEAGLTRTGSDLGAALDIAGRILATSTNAGKAVIVVSDGEDFGGTYQAKADALRQAGVTVYAAGVGTTAGAPLFDIDRNGAVKPKLDKNGQRVISRLNESSLQQVAGDRGRYVHLGDASLVDFRDDLASLQQTPIGEELQKLPVERFQWFAGAALALLLAAWLLPARLALPRLGALRLRPYGAAAALLLMLVAGACSGGDNSLRNRNAQANRLYGDGDYEGALKIYQQLVAERPDLPEFSYNTGNTLNRLGDFERAVEETRRALPPTSAGLGSATYYALGNHFLALNRLEEAFDSYRSALLIAPNDIEAKHNLEVTLLLLAARQQDDNQAQQPPSEGEDGQPDQPPGEGTPDASATPSASSTPSPQAAQRELNDALKGLNEDLTFEEAVHILDLLREQQAAQQPSQPSFNPGPDY